MIFVLDSISIIFLFGEQEPIILIKNMKGKKIYYSAKSKSNQEIFNELKITFPDRFN